MGKPPAPGNDDTVLHRLISKARKLALTPPNRQLVKEMREKARREAAKVCLDPLLTPGSPPEEFIEALRLPEGDQHHLTVTIDGHRVPLILNPRGKADPQRETELWGWLLERVRQEAQ